MLRTFKYAVAVASLVIVAPAIARTTHEEPKEVRWSFEGPFGRFDQAQLQRGYKVYRENCSSCHSMRLVSFRNLGGPGGPFFNAKYKNPNDNPTVKAIAKDYQVDDIDSETGDVIKRPATAADRFPSPYANEAAARAGNGGALPPDMSLLAKAREGGPAYIYSIVTGYHAAPRAMSVPAGKYYNPYMPGDMTAFWAGPHDKVPVGGFIAMPPPLAPNKTTFDDGTPSTVEQQAKDVAAFLMWAAEPKMDERKQTGLAVVLYLLLFSGLLYASYRQVWRNESH